MNGWLLSLALSGWQRSTLQTQAFPVSPLGSSARVYGLIWHGDYTSLNGGPQPLKEV